MISSVAIVRGFKHEIQEKVSAFSGHIQITNFDNNNSVELAPINLQQNWLTSLKKDKDIQSINPFALKAGIISTKENIHGILLKGVDTTFNWVYFHKWLKEGKLPNFKDTADYNKILLSTSTAKLMNLKVGDKARMFFINNNQLRNRVFIICGLFESGFAESDNTFAVVNLKHIQKLNNWTEQQTGGYELLLTDFNRIDETDQKIYDRISQNLNTTTIKAMKPEIFNWLDFLNINIRVILILMIAVAIINLVSALLILILERTSTIGILKALGYRNRKIRTVFLLISSKILFKGLLWGNAIAIGLCLLQYYTGIIKLPQESYYVSQVPIILNISDILLINAGTIIICISALIIPAFFIGRITPIKAIEFE